MQKKYVSKALILNFVFFMILSISIMTAVVYASFSASAVVTGTITFDMPTHTFVLSTYSDASGIMPGNESTATYEIAYTNGSTVSSQYPSFDCYLGIGINDITVGKDEDTLNLSSIEKVGNNYVYHYTFNNVDVLTVTAIPVTISTTTYTWAVYPKTREATWNSVNSNITSNFSDYVLVPCVDGTPYAFYTDSTSGLTMNNLQLSYAMPEGNDGGFKGTTGDSFAIDLTGKTFTHNITLNWYENLNL